jgi:uncharacterized protein
MTKILVSLTHPAHINFFRYAADILVQKHNCQIQFFILPRGKLVSIFEREMGKFTYTKMGKYRSSLIGKALSVSEQCLTILTNGRRQGFDIATGFSNGDGLCHAVYLLHKPSVIFDDDVEYKLNFYPYKPFATRIVLPQSIPIRSNNIKKYAGFKELAYLHPNYFEPDVRKLSPYGLSPNEYVFIREVSSSTLNYRELPMGQLAEVCPRLKDLGFKIVLSLEEKKLKKLFEKDCIILEEPVEDIYSLQHFALFTISSGDTVARESPLLGTPVIYTGGRKMSVNQPLVEKGILFEANHEQPVLFLIDKIIKQKLKERTKSVVQQAISAEWEDTTQVIIRNLMEFARPN